MANLMYADMLMNTMGGIGQYLVSREDAKLAASQRRYNRTMSALSASVARNVVTENEAALRDQSVFARLSIQAAGMQERAAFDVEAAAAGIAGNSIEVGRAQRQADEHRARTSMERQAMQKRREYGQQRQQITMDEIRSRDVSPLPRANLGASLFNIAGGLVDTWNVHNPVDRRTTTTLSR